jgi:Tfp pilus assembly protein PilF
MLIHRSLLMWLACGIFGIAPIAATCQSPKNNNEEAGPSTRRQQADALIQKALERFAAEDFKGNVQILKEAATIDPTNPRVWWKLCEAYQLTEEMNLAIDACKRNLEINPDGVSHNSLGLVYLAQKDYKHAQQEFEKATADSSVPPIVYQNLVFALSGSKQYERAASSAERMIEVSAGDPPNIKSGYELLLWALFDSKQYEKMAASAQRLIGASPDDPSSVRLGYEMLGVADDKIGRTTEAQRAFAKAGFVSCQIGNNDKGEPSLNCHN